MKIFSSELAHNYASYTFGYAQYAQYEPGDSLDKIYAAGYLPYSGARSTKKVFYRARSARLSLTEFQPRSENRRIAKKFDGVFIKKCVSFSDFKITEDFLEFCLSYFAQKHGPRAMPRERLEFILASGLISNIITYHKNDKPAAYVLEVGDETMRHYWFSFYDLLLARQSLGLWLMLDCLRAAKTAGIEHYYIGTVYGEKALYKTNFKPLQWWDGEIWNKNVRTLKERSRADFARATPLIDEWKKDNKLF